MTETVEKFFHRHTPVVITMAQAVVELKRSGVENLESQNKLHVSLDKFYTARTNVRMLVQQHIEMFGKEKHNNSSMIGMIDRHCKPAAVAHDAALDAKVLFLSLLYFLSFKLSFGRLYASQLSGLHQKSKSLRQPETQSFLSFLLICITFCSSC
jgi:hypothetical protein